MEGEQEDRIFSDVGDESARCRIFDQFAKPDAEQSSGESDDDEKWDAECSVDAVFADGHIDAGIKTACQDVDDKYRCD